MQLSILARTEGPWTVVYIGGDIDLSTAPQVRERVIDLITAGQRNLILDLDHVDFLDSTGLAVLVTTLHRVRAINGVLHLVCSNDRVLRPLRVTGLLNAFSHLTNVDEVLAGAAGRQRSVPLR